MGVDGEKLEMLFVHPGFFWAWSGTTADRDGGS